MEGHRFRAHLVLAVLMAFFGALGVRLFHIQARGDERFRSLALRQHARYRIVSARRGEIRTRDGEVLAVSLRSRSVFAEPVRMESPLEGARKIGDALSLSPPERRRLEDRLSDPRRRRFAWVRRQITDSQASRLRDLDLKGVGFREEFRRFYPYGPVASQVLGFVGVDHRGLAGVEQSFESTLAGQSGWRGVWRDARGRGVLPPASLSAAPVDGWNVVLTIDGAIQCALENVLEKVHRIHRPRVAIGVALDPRNGDILAVAQRPTFDPNRYSLASPETWRLRALTDTYEPGSTIKPLIAAACLEEGITHLAEPVDCEQGAWRIEHRTLHDFHPYGVLPFSAVVSKSSNIGMAKMGIRLGPERLRDWVVKFGLVTPTTLPLPGEGRGHVTALDRWNLYSTTSVPMGHEVATTPIRLACAYAALANGGILREPRLVMGVHGPRSRRDFPPDEGTRILSPLVAKGQIGAALVSTVVQGTGKRSSIAGVAVAGKTGTAEIIGRQDKVVASFIGYAPAEDPEILVLILVEEPQGKRPTGGTVAAPAVRAVLKEALCSPGRHPAQ